MARKNIISKTFFNATVSGDTTSDVIHVSQCDYGSIHITWTGASTPNIDVYVQVINGVNTSDSYRNLSLGTINISGASGEHEIVLDQMPFTDFKVFFDRASGSAPIKATFTAKSSGA